MNPLKILSVMFLCLSFSQGIAQKKKPKKPSNQGN